MPANNVTALIRPHWHIVLCSCKRFANAMRGPGPAYHRLHRMLACTRRHARHCPLTAHDATRPHLHMHADARTSFSTSAICPNTRMHSSRLLLSRIQAARPPCRDCATPQSLHSLQSFGPNPRSPLKRQHLAAWCYPGAFAPAATTLLGQQDESSLVFSSHRYSYRNMRKQVCTRRCTSNQRSRASPWGQPHARVSMRWSLEERAIQAIKAMLFTSLFRLTHTHTHMGFVLLLFYTHAHTTTSLFVLVLFSSHLKSQGNPRRHHTHTLCLTSACPRCRTAPAARTCPR